MSEAVPNPNARHVGASAAHCGGVADGAASYVVDSSVPTSTDDSALCSGWRHTDLASLGEYINGFAFNQEHWADNGLPIVRIAQITGSQGIVDRFQGRLPDTYRLSDGDLIFSWSGTLAVVRWQGGPAWLNQHLFKVVPRVGTERDFLYHVLRASVAEMDKRTHGSTMKHIKRGELREFALAVPIESAEQSLVARVLDTLDTTIRQTEAIIAKLKQVKQGLLHDLLTRGIDANGELRPRQSEAPHLYKQSPLGWIPKEWAPHALGQVLIGGTRNGLYKPSSFHGSGPLMVQMGGMFRGEAVDFQSATRIRVTRPELNTFGIEVGDLLFARRSLTFEGAGQCAIVRNLPEASTFESSIVRARVDRNRVEPEFAALFLRGALSSAHRRTLIRQVAVSGVSGDDIAHFLFALPSLAEQVAIIDAIASAQSRIEHEAIELHKFSFQKSGLMDDLLTGRVRVTPLLETAAA